MGQTKTDKRIFGHIQRQERRILRSLSLISVVTAILYACGVVWRTFYYQALGIPVSIIDFPFPIILIPKADLIVFISQGMLSFLAVKYYSFYQQQKRLERAKTMGISQPLDLIVSYAAQNNVKYPNTEKRNTTVLYDFFIEYIKKNKKNKSDWEFDITEFESEALKLFPDLPHQIKDSFVRYELQLLIMDSQELKETIGDSIGSFPRSSKMFDMINNSLLYMWILFCVATAVFLTADILWTLLYAALGVGVGYILAKLSEREDRYQLWHTIWVAVILLIILNAISGYVTAKSNLKNLLFPIATITLTNGTEHNGLLLGSFSDGYVITEVDDNDFYKLRKIHKDAIASVSIQTIGRLLRNLEGLKEKMETIQKELENIKTELEVPEKAKNTSNSNDIVPVQR